ELAHPLGLAARAVGGAYAMRGEAAYSAAPMKVEGSPADAESMLAVWMVSWAAFGARSRSTAAMEALISALRAAANARLRSAATASIEALASACWRATNSRARCASQRGR